MAKKTQTKSVSSLRQVKGEVWEVGRRAINVSIRELEVAGERPELLLAVRAGAAREVLLVDGVPSSAPPEVLAEFVVRAMRKPQNEKPHRPEVVRVSTAAEAESLSQTLAAAAVELQVTPELAALDAALEQVKGMLNTALELGNDYRTQAARAGQSLSDEGLREFFETAKEFYNEELWLDYGDDSVFEIELQFADGPSKTLYGALMGGMGQEFGLALYPSFEDFQRFYEIGFQQLDEFGEFPDLSDPAAFDSDEWQQHGELLGSALSVPCIGLTYTPENNVSASLVQEAKRLKLPVADKTAFPFVLTTGQGRMQIASGEDLRDMLLAMKAILDWDEQVLEMDPEDDIGFMTTVNIPGVAEFHPPVTARTTLRLNPLVPEDDDDFFDADMDGLIGEFSGRLNSGQPGRKPTSGKKKKPAKKPSGSKATGPQSPQLYTLRVGLSHGPVSEKYAGQEISRTIQIHGQQTLHDLHGAIFDAFDREEEHLYEFNFGEGPEDRSEIYSYHSEWDDELEDAGDTDTTTLDSLNLEVGRYFGYIFDMGDYWEHVIEVAAVEGAPAKIESPRLLESVGPSPPQYPDEDDDE
jgi:hypothetical protein